MAIVNMITNIINTVSAIHRTNSEMFESYMELLQLNEDLHQLAKNDKQSQCNGFAVSLLTPVIHPHLQRTLQLLRHELELLGRVRELLVAYRQVHQDLVTNPEESISLTVSNQLADQSRSI